ncbi:podoplanin [Heterocephalus glaber]|uniref:Podoplanin n=1 Tax=Heterocephalus glaber TaxID=10181 RepID=A0AAX6PF00_HETGA|nr:podoplanin [Heterocephalus glaber]
MRVRSGGLGQVCSPGASGSGAGRLPWALRSNRTRFPLPASPGLRLRSFSSAPTLPQELAAEHQPSGRMWTAPVLLWIVGSASLWVPAQAAVFAKLEDNPVTSGATVARGTPGKEDLIPTTSGSEAPRPSPRLTTQGPAGAESTTGPGVEDVSTLGSSTQNHQKSQTTTTPPMATNTSTVTVTESTQTAVHKDGLSTASLAGIVIGVLITIGFLGGVIFLFVWKMSK